MKPWHKELWIIKIQKIELTFSQVDLKIHSIAGWKKLEIDDFTSTMVGTPNTCLVS